MIIIITFLLPLRYLLNLLKVEEGKYFIVWSLIRIFALVRG